MIFAVAAAALCAASGTDRALLRCSSSTALCGASHLELAQKLLQRPDVFDAVLEAEFADSAPVMVPLCWSAAEWRRSELNELQWPPLVAAAGERAAELRRLAEEHAQADYKAFGRFKGKQALLVALELVHCHAMKADDGEALWFVPERASHRRSAPIGASLTIDAATGDLVFIGDGCDTSPGSRATQPAPASPNPLFFFLGGGSDEERGESFSISSGSKSNDQLLLTEGWADEELSCERFAFPQEALMAAAAEVWTNETDASARALDSEIHGLVVSGLRAGGILPDDDGFGEVFAGGLASVGLMCSVRALALSEDSFEAAGGVQGCVEALSTGQSAAFPMLENRSQRILSCACAHLTRSFPTTAEADARLLVEAIAEDSGQLSDHRRIQCLRSRLSRKRCLNDLFKEAEQGRARGAVGPGVEAAA